MHKFSKSEIEKIDWYHTFQFGNITTHGRYDWRPYLAELELPNLKAKRVLDVGAGNGYFSFEFEKLGAKVTATDIPLQEDRDNHLLGVKIKSNNKMINFNKPFLIAKHYFKSKINQKFINIYDMTPKNTGHYDLLFCNDVLLHLTDPVKALNIFSKLAKIVIVGTPITELKLNALQRWCYGVSMAKIPSFASFWGATGNGAYWLPTLTCLEDMAKSAGMKVIKSKVINIREEHAECSLPRGIVFAKNK